MTSRRDTCWRRKERLLTALMMASGKVVVEVLGGRGGESMEVQAKNGVGGADAGEPERP